MNKIILSNVFEQILLANWASFLDKRQLLKNVLEDARNNEYPISLQEEIPPRHIKMTLTKFSTTNNMFTIWIEFTVPKEEGVVVGSHVYNLKLNGELSLVESFGTHFCTSI
jgi:hypothetical protein